MADIKLMTVVDANDQKVILSFINGQDLLMSVYRNGTFLESFNLTDIETNEKWFNSLISKYILQKNLHMKYDDVEQEFTFKNFNAYVKHRYEIIKANAEELKEARCKYVKEIIEAEKFEIANTEQRRKLDVKMAYKKELMEKHNQENMCTYLVYQPPTINDTYHLLIKKTDIGLTASIARHSPKVPGVYHHLWMITYDKDPQKFVNALLKYRTVSFDIEDGTIEHINIEKVTTELAKNYEIVFIIQRQIELADII